MAHISSIGAAMFSDLSVSMPSSATNFSSVDTVTEFQALFATEIASVGGTKAANTFVRVKSVREFPPMGTPPNIVNVPTFGQKTSQQIQGQSDAPNLEITLNYIPSEWSKDAGNLLGNAVADGNLYIFRFTLMNTDSTGSTTDTKYASTVAGLGTVQNSQYYWIGKMEAINVTPSLTDATQATLTLSLQSPFYGPWTI